MQTAIEWLKWAGESLLYAIDTWPKVVAVVWPASILLVVYLMWG